MMLLVVIVLIQSRYIIFRNVKDYGLPLRCQKTSLHALSDPESEHESALKNLEVLADVTFDFDGATIVQNVDRQHATI